MDHIIITFKAYLLAQHRSIRTIQAYETDLKQLLEWLTKQEITEFSSIKPSHLTIFLQEKIPSSPLTATIRRKRAALKSWVAFCTKQRLITFTTMDVSWPTLTSKTLYSVTTKASPVQDLQKELIMHLLHETNIKLSELVTLTALSLDHKEHALRVVRNDSIIPLFLNLITYKKLSEYCTFIGSQERLFPFSRRALTAYLKKITLKKEAVYTYSQNSFTHNLGDYKKFHPRN